MPEHRELSSPGELPTAEEKRRERSSDVIDQVESRFGRNFLQAIRGLAILVRDFGMSVVAFAFGIYFLVQLSWSASLSDGYRALIGGALVAVGVLTQIWLYAREHPRRASDDTARHLERMSDLVERYTRSHLDR